jgi:predicted double-glycine peptidase
MFRENASLENLKKYLRNHLVIVSFWIPYYKESHYSIVKKINSERIYLHDTWFGSNHCLKINYFLKNWYDEDCTGWLMAITKQKDSLS